MIPMALQHHPVGVKPASPWGEKSLPGADDRHGVTLRRMVERTGAARPAPPRGAGPFRRNATAPRVRPGTIGRDRLVRRLCAADANEVIIAAPAGYGKTTLAAIWADRDPRPFGWITVDEGDSDPVVFLHDIALALDSINPSEDSLIDELTVAQSPWPAMLPRVLDRVAAAPERFVLVLDDAHRMTGSSATEVLPALVENVPQGSAVAIVTRGRIPHPVSRELLGGARLPPRRRRPGDGPGVKPRGCSWRRVSRRTGGMST